MNWRHTHNYVNVWTGKNIPVQFITAIGYSIFKVKDEQGNVYLADRNFVKKIKDNFHAEGYTHDGTG